MQRNYRHQQHPPQGTMAAPISPCTHIENLRGNVNTRLQKLAEENWDGAIFAAGRAGTY